MAHPREALAEIDRPSAKDAEAIHIIRTARIPFVESRASNALIMTTIIICAVGVMLPFTWAGSVLGFTPLPGLYWPLVAIMLLTYGVLTHLVKVWFIRKWGL